MQVVLLGVAIPGILLAQCFLVVASLRGLLRRLTFRTAVVSLSTDTSLQCWAGLCTVPTIDALSQIP
jgi:hypothetical protein